MLRLLLRLRSGKLVRVSWDYSAGESQRISEGECGEVAADGQCSAESC